MRFRCPVCGADHGEQDSFFRNAERGTFVMTPWLKDEKGVDVFAIACLRCGSVHATSGSPAKALFSFGTRALTIRHTWRIGDLKERISREGNALPEVVTNVLIDRGFLGERHASITQEKVDVALLAFAMHCSLRGEFTTDAVWKYLTEAEALERSGTTNTQTAAANILKKLMQSGLRPDQIAAHAYRFSQEALNSDS